MAWLSRRDWIRRRYGSYAGRARSFRRQFYNRTWFNRRRYTRNRRRRRPLYRRRFRVSKWMPVRQHNPRHVVSCHIRGWMPGLLCAPAAPVFRPMRMSAEDSFRTGGWTIHEFSLKGFYAEHKIYRNTWSRTNCGFDIARYLGTRITLWPTEETDYIVWWDVDYETESEFEMILKKVHPALLLGRAHTRIVLSRKTSMKYRPRHIWLPPPAKYKNEWATQKTWNSRGLAIVAISMIDLTYPWILGKMEEYQVQSGNPTWLPPWDMWDYSEGTGLKEDLVVAKKVAQSLDKMWWVKGSTENKNLPTAWADAWPTWDKRKFKSFKSDDKFIAVAQGPFVKKYPGSECQIIWTYNSHWKWGGDVSISSEQVCDPETAIPTMRKKRAYVEEPYDPGYFISAEDIRKDGFIKPEAWQRITRPPPQNIGFTHYPGETEDEYTPKTPDPYVATDTSEEDSPYPRPKRRRISRRRLDGSGLDNLKRLRYLLKHFLQNKKSFSE
nr:MAG: ORF1 [Giant panda anellovirus]